MTPRPRTSLTAQQVATIKEMVLKNNSNAAISLAIDINKNPVAYVAKSVRSGAGVAKVDGPGRPPLLSPRGIRALARIVKVYRISSDDEITRRVNAPRTSAVSTRTVRRAMHKLGFMSATPANKPWMSDEKKVKRVAWAKERRSWDREWSSVFFTDESSLEVKRPGRARVWRSVGERFQPSCLRPSFKSGSQTLMVWAGFSARGRAPLRRVCESVNTEQYEKVLAGDIFNYIVADYGAPDAAWPQEDMAPCPASKRTRAAKSALGLKPLSWMGQSPKLNPIENAWNELDRRLRSRTTSPKNLDEQWEALCEEGDAIPTAFFESLTQSMSRRVNAVIASKGAGTKNSLLRSEGKVVAAGG